MISAKSQTFHFRRLGQMEVQRDVTLADLKALADWAFMHPMDEISLDGRNWIKAYEFKELQMVWLIIQDGEVIYGPTTEGTLKEFFINQEIAADQPLRHYATGVETTLQDVIGRDYIQRLSHPPTLPQRESLKHIKT